LIKKRSFLRKSVVVGKEWMTEVERVTDAMATKYGLEERKRKGNRPARGSQGPFV
jgi:hypothetical protein